MVDQFNGGLAGGGITEGFEQVFERIRDLDERAFEVAKKTGNQALDVYEKALESILDLEGKVAAASGLDFIDSLTRAHVSFVTDMSKVFTDAAREALR